MSNTRNTGFLTNVVKYTDKGDISFVSGSTTLMSISSSGAVTVTGVISGSNALTSSYSQNSELLDNLDSTAFVFTSSFNTYSSSMSTRVTNNESTGSTLTTASASFAVVSSSYSSASGSLSTRVTTLENASASLNTASGSFSTRVTRIEGNYATTGSNVFLGAQTVCANITSTGTIIAQTLNVQQVTSSVVYSSGSNVFGCSLANTQQFTGSVTMTGSLNVAGNTCVVSICSPAHVGGTFSGTTACLSTAICSDKGYFTGISLGGTPISATTNATQLRFTNSGGDLYVGQEGSVAGGFYPGACAYDNVIYTNCPVNIIISGTSRMKLFNSGITCFQNTVCAPTFVGTSFSGTNYSATQFTGKLYSGGTYNFEGLYAGKSTSNGGALIEMLGHGNLCCSYGFGIRFDTDQSSNLLIQYAPTTSSYATVCYSTVAQITSTGGAVFNGALTLNAANNQIRSGNELRFYRADNGIYTQLYDAGALAANGFVLDNTNAEGFHFKNNGATVMRMNSSGNVGIGTCTPTAPLTIRCDSSSGASFMEIATCFNNAYRYVSINGGSGIEYCIPAGTSQSPYIQVQGGSPAAGGGSFKIRTGAMGSVSDRVIITQDGIACFACQICTSGLLNRSFRISNARVNGTWQEWVANGITLTANSAIAFFCILNQYDNLIIDLAAWVDQGAWSPVSYRFNFGYNVGTSYVAQLGAVSAICGLSGGTTYNETWCWKNCSGGNIGNSAISLRIFGKGTYTDVSTGGTDLIASSYLTRVS